ncbi:MAG: hypothetical protein ACUVSY_11185 [Roseiflexus sp.]
MNIVLTLILAILLAAGLGIAVALAINGVGFALRLPKRRCPVSIDSLVSIVSITLIVLAYAVLPWPLHPAGASAWVGQPALVWVLVEGAFLVSAFAGLLAPSPSAARAALREAQVNVAGRLALWVVVGSSLWSGVGWSALEVLGRAFLFLVGVVVVAASAGLGPFAPDTSLAPSGAEEGLGTDERWLAQMARQMRAGLVLALFVVGILPGSDVVQPQIAAIIAPALLAVLLAGLRQARRTLPLAPLHTTVHWCLWRALPVALIGSVYLHLMAR